MVTCWGFNNVAEEAEVVVWQRTLPNTDYCAKLRSESHKHASLSDLDSDISAPTASTIPSPTLQADPFEIV